jgi:ribosomal protein L34E
MLLLLLLLPCMSLDLLALYRRNTKNGKCAACEQPTQGIFNIATDVLKKMKKAKDAAPKEAAAAADGGDD